MCEEYLLCLSYLGRPLSREICVYALTCLHRLILQIPQRLYTLDELRLNGIETTALLSPVDSTLGSIERTFQAASLLGGITAWNAFELSPQQILFASLGLLFLWTLDGVSCGYVSTVFS